MINNSLRRMGFIWLTCPQNSASSKVVSAGTHTGQEPGDRSWCRGHGGVLLTVLLPMACSVCFPIEPSSGIALLTMGGALPCQSQLKTIPDRFTYSLVLWRHFLSWGSFLPNAFSLCQGDIKLSSTEWEHSLFTMKSLFGLCICLPSS